MCAVIGYISNVQTGDRSQFLTRYLGQSTTHKVEGEPNNRIPAHQDWLKGVRCLLGPARLLPSKDRTLFCTGYFIYVQAQAIFGKVLVKRAQSTNSVYQIPIYSPG